MNPNDLSAIVARNVRAIIAAKSLTQADVANKGSISQKTVSNIVAGDDDSETRPSSTTLEKLEAVARALEIEPWKLLMNLTPDERRAWDQIEQAYWAIQPKSPKPLLTITTRQPSKANGLS